MTHVCDVHEIREGRYVIGYYAACETCGWTGDERQAAHRGRAIADLLKHHQTTKD